MDWFSISQLDDPITICVNFIRAFGGYEEAALIRQITYWMRASKDPDGWTYQDSNDIEERLAIPYKKQYRIRQEMVERGILEERYDRESHKTYFRVIREAFNAAVLAAEAPDKLSSAHRTKREIPPDKLSSGTGQKGDSYKEQSKIITEQPTELKPCRVCGETGIHTCVRALPKPERRERRPKWQRAEKSIYRETPKTPPVPDWDPEGFAQFFAAYPLQIHEDEARAAWNEMRPPAASVLAGITRWRDTKRWQKNEGEFIPNPEKFLLKKWWRDNPKPNIEGGLNAREELQKKNAETVARVRAKRSDSAAATGVRRLLQGHVN